VAGAEEIAPLPLAEFQPHLLAGSIICKRPHLVPIFSFTRYGERSTLNPIVKMVFFMFGPSYDVWALGNEVWTAWADNLDTGLKTLFEGSELSGDTIDWVSTGTDGKIYMSLFPRVLDYRGIYHAKQISRCNFR
jgi:hypothetical protein